MPRILHPFPDIAVHFIQAPRVGGQALDWDGLLPVQALLASGIGVLAVIVDLLRGDVAAEAEWRGGSGTTGVFPLRLGWQA